MNTRISPSAIKNFNTLLLAAANNDLCLAQCVEADSGKVINVICATTQHSNGMVELVPLAKQFSGNPYAEINPPTVDSPKAIGDVSR